MRQRYYDLEIKRFINQDILTGSIGDSQSLNRYAYVQGNPVSYSDPFGLSPFERLRQAFRPLHAVLNIAGIIPGPVGMLASLAQAGLYGLEGNSALAAHYLSQSLMIGLAGPVGGAVLGALSKMGPAAKVILGTVLGAQSLYTAGVAGINLYNSASTIADGLLNGDMSWLDAFCEGSMALNSAAGIYYSLKGLLGGCELALKGLDDVAASYAAKQEAWYKEHAGTVQDGCSIATGSYTDRQTGQIVEAGACFIAGTKIQTPDGEVNIEDIQAGNLVYACNVDTGEVGVKEVKQTFVREVNTLVHVFVGDEEIITTTNHPFYVVGEGFVQAGDLKVGSPLLLLDGTTEKVSRIYVEALQTPVKVYNFEVEDWHTYYVSEEACLVHNLCGVGDGGSGYYQDTNGRWHRPNGQFASNAEMGIETPVKTSTGTHGNSLSDPRTNYGYALVDKDTNEILKFGETLYPDSRYSQNFLDKNNAKMIIMEQGSKADIHFWQHDMNEYYYDKYNEYPPLNSKGW